MNNGWGQVAKIEPQRLITTYVIVLMGRHRYAKVQFLFNEATRQSISTKKDHNLHSLLQQKFGPDAIGILVAGEPWYDEEDLMRTDILPAKGGHFYVLYDDNTPCYSEATQSPPLYDIPDIALPTFDAAAGAAPTPTAGRRERRAHGYTYYEDIPTFTRSIALRTSDGRTRPLTLSNKDTDHVDQVNHFLSLHGGDRWMGVRAGEREYTDDSLLFSADLREGGTYQVTYRPPGRLNVLGRAREKRREVVYSPAGTST